MTGQGFPLSGLDEADVGRVAAAVGAAGVEDMYRLSPLQEGLLYHAVHRGESDAYHQQTSCRLEGRLEAGRFRRAWEQVVARHGALRTRFFWEGLRTPVQVVQRRGGLVWDELDWSGRSAESQLAELTRYREWHRTAGIDVAAGVTSRVTLIRMGLRCYEFVWSFHHVLLDGWSVPLVIRDVVRHYASPSTPVAPAGRFGDYMAWLARQDEAAAAEYWRGQLGGMAAPTPLPRPTHGVPRAAGMRGTVARRVDASTTRALRAFARSLRVTLNTVVQAAWALVLGRSCGEREVVFGSAVSGRPPEVPGVETTVGMFINTLPVRVSLDAGQPVRLWLAELLAQSVAIQRYGYVPLVAVHGWSAVPRTQPLFQTLLAFENYPTTSETSVRAQSAGVAIVPSHLVDRPHYPLAACVDVTGTLNVVMHFDGRIYSPCSVDAVTGSFLAAVQTLTESRNETVGDLERRLEVLEERDRAAAAHDYAVDRRRQLDRIVRRRGI